MNYWKLVNQMAALGSVGFRAVDVGWEAWWEPSKPDDEDPAPEVTRAFSPKSLDDALEELLEKMIKDGWTPGDPLE